MIGGLIVIKNKRYIRKKFKLPNVIKGKTSTKQSNPCQNLPTLIELRTGAIGVAKSEAWDWTDKGLIESNPDALAKLKDYYLAAIDRTPYQISRPYEVAKKEADRKAENASKGEEGYY